VPEKRQALSASYGPPYSTNRICDKSSGIYAGQIAHTTRHAVHAESTKRKPHESRELPSEDRPDRPAENAVMAREHSNKKQKEIDTNARQDESCLAQPSTTHHDSAPFRASIFLSIRTGRPQPPSIVLPRRPVPSLRLLFSAPKRPSYFNAMYHLIPS
jgi:hypothetical protein